MTRPLLFLAALALAFSPLAVNAAQADCDMTGMDDEHGHVCGRHGFGHRPGPLLRPWQGDVGQGLRPGLRDQLRLGCRRAG